MKAREADLARAVLEGGASQRLRFDEDDLAALFAPLQAASTHPKSGTQVVFVAFPARSDKILTK